MDTHRVARIAILGAESTGKSTLAAALAAHYDTLWVPEYLREFVQAQGRTPQEHEQFHIATTQLAREQAAAAGLNAVQTDQTFALLFCDTTPLMTAIYSHFYWGRVGEPLAALARTAGYHHTLVTAPDGSWTADGLMRESPAVQQTIHRMLLTTLDEMAIPYQLLAGDPTERQQQVESRLAPMLSRPR